MIAKRQFVFIGGVVLLVGVAFLLFAADSAAETPHSAREVAGSGGECSAPARSSRKGVACAVPIYRLLVLPKDFDGNRIAFFAHLRIESAGTDSPDYYLAAPSAMTLEVSDPYSCVRVQVAGSVLSPQSKYGNPVADGTYVARIEGTFRATEGSWCVGILKDADIAIRWRTSDLGSSGPGSAE